MLIEQVTSSGIVHGLVGKLPNSVKDNNFKHSSPEMKEKLKKEREREQKRVRVQFVSKKGTALSLPYMNWAGDAIEMWHLLPDQIYTVAQGMIDKINASGRNIRSQEEGDLRAKTPSTKVDQTIVSKEWQYKLVPAF